MTIKIDADTTSGLQLESDTSGIIDIQSAGVTKMTVGTTIDIQGNELVLDADADTSIHADTDDRIDFKVGGVDVAKIDSNGVEGASLVRLAGETLTSNTSTIEFSTSIITTTYKSYILYARMRPVTDIARLLLRFNDNTGTLLATVTDYQVQAYRGSGIDFNDDTMSSITHIGGTGTGTGEYVVQKYEIHEPRATDRKTIITFHCGYVDTVGDSALTIGSGTCDTAEDNQGFRIFFDNGDMASGSSYVLFGVKG